MGNICTERKEESYNYNVTYEGGKVSFLGLDTNITAERIETEIAEMVGKKRTTRTSRKDSDSKQEAKLAS
jgi:hypothetical protein